MSAKPQPYYGQTVDDYITNDYLPWLEATAGARIDALIDQLAIEIGVAGPGIEAVRDRLKNADLAARERAQADAAVSINELPLEGPG